VYRYRYRAFWCGPSGRGREGRNIEGSKLEVDSEVGCGHGDPRGRRFETLKRTKIACVYRLRLKFLILVSYRYTVTFADVARLRRLGGFADKWYKKQVSLVSFQLEYASANGKGSRSAEGMWFKEASCDTGIDFKSSKHSRSADSPLDDSGVRQCVFCSHSTAVYTGADSMRD
jgi:hypothetical protein